jgi:hypothetical protein
MLTVPSYTVPNFVLVPVHDLEPGDRSLMPVLDFAENGLDVIGDRKSTISSVSNRNGVSSDLLNQRHSSWVACSDVLL